MKFCVGDKVKCICADASSGYFDYEEAGELTKGKTYTVLGVSTSMISVLGDNGIRQNPVKSRFIKIGGSMQSITKYEELKSRIEALSNGWDKAADDVLVEIGRASDYRISIPTWNNLHGDGIKISGDWDRTVCANFVYSGQCEKHSAFKKALLWLLDHSDIKKDDSDLKADKIKELEGKLRDIQKEIKELK